jgi:hypothetical protein
MTAVDRIARFPDPRHARAAARTRRWEIRKKAGLGVLQIETHLGLLADQLVADKFLAEWDSEDRSAIERALERMLRIYILGTDASGVSTD